MRIQPLIAPFAVSLVTVFAFTNCGDGFDSVQDSFTQASAACFLKMREEPAFRVLAEACHATDDYICERRIFHPAVRTESATRSECGLADGLGSVCVTVLIHSFNTEAARSTASESDFDSGGDYNREEIQCSHTKLIKAGVSLIQAEGATVFEALSNAVQECQARGVK